MNIPNILSIFRLFVTIFFVLAVNQGRLRLALLLFILQGVSDLLDGFLARIMNKRTPLGAFLDPIADKAMLVSAYVVLYIHDIIPLWVTLVVLLKDVVMAIGFLILYRIFGKVRLIPSIYGKTSTLLQILTVVYVLWSEGDAYSMYFFLPTVVVTVIAGVLYMVRGFSILLKREPAS
jgi:cardiolipin synthase (CMP-forming)